MRNNIFKKLLVFVTIIILSSSVVSNISGFNQEIIEVENDAINFKFNDNKVTVSCNVYGINGQSPKKVELQKSQAEDLIDKINGLAFKIAGDYPVSEIEKLQQNIIIIGKEYGLIQDDISLLDLKPKFATLLDSEIGITPVIGNRGTASFCNFVTTGSGMQFPIIIFPRLIPILMTPIPRAFLHWNADEGVTSCGGMISGKGFIAEGMQSGTALGFWGIGFSIFLPPVMAYGFFGYALFSTCTAEIIEPWPPNNAPIISDESPVSGEWGVSVATNELSFNIEDPDGDRMDYKVTTYPDVGSGSGQNKKDGIYKIPISNLEHTTPYTWIVEVTDSYDTVSNEFSFMTEELPFNPFEEGWQYRKKITIDHSKVEGYHDNFPVLISTIDNDIKAKAQYDGSDILFMDDTGTAYKMYHELEKFNCGSGEMIAWVNVDEISSNADTIFYMYYGNPSCGNQQISNWVWDSNYKAVYHMDYTSGGLIDSTTNSYDCTSVSGTPDFLYPGKIGNAINFEESEDEHFNDGDILDNLEEITVECWLNLDTIPLTHNAAMVTHEDAWYFLARGMQSGEDIQKKFQWAIHGDEGSLFSSEEVILGKWEYLVGTFIDSLNEIKLYRNGDLTDQKSWDGHMPDDSSPFAVGDQIGNNHHFDGILDEIRISNIARDEDWISTTYKNHNDPEDFLNIGPEET